jgi:uncharacterized glyoxalase superfamily protein PhnB
MRVRELDAEKPPMTARPGIRQPRRTLRDPPWGRRDFPLLDPSGVLWRIGAPIRR